jgi:hypothetical protein
MQTKATRLDTKLECEGAEFLVLGNLLVHRIPAYKTYTNMPRYDLVATHPERNSSARIQVKSRWHTGATAFLMKRFDCDFVVVVCLNRGKKRGGVVRSPEFFVLPVALVKEAPRSRKWNKIRFRDLESFHSYRDRWELIQHFLESCQA